MFTIITNGCPSGFGFVRDHLGNKSYYGTIDECKKYIKSMEREYQRYVNSIRRRIKR